MECGITHTCIISRRAWMYKTEYTLFAARAVGFRTVEKVR